MAISINSSRSQRKRLAVGCALGLAILAGFAYFMTPSVRHSHAATALPGDINKDSKVDIFDLSVLLSNFGKTTAGVPGDVNGDNTVNIFDLSILLTNFGKTSPSSTPTPLVTPTQTPPPVTNASKIYGVNNIGGWGLGYYAEAKRTLGVNGERTGIEQNSQYFGVDNVRRSLPAAGDQNIRMTLVINNGQPLKQLAANPMAYINFVAATVKEFGPGGTFYTGANAKYAPQAVQTFEILNEPDVPVYRSGDTDAASYGKIARAAADAAHAANPKAKVYIYLGGWGQNPEYTGWNNRVLAAAPDLYSHVDGFVTHVYSDTHKGDYIGHITTEMDGYKNYAWGKPGGNGKPFIMTETNIWNGPESAHVQFMTDVVAAFKARPWWIENHIFAWHGYDGAGAPADWQGFYTSGGPNTTKFRPERAAAYKAAITKAMSTP